MIDPKDRLGSPDSKNDIQNLKSHPFFKGIDFNNLQKYNVKKIIEEDDLSRKTDSLKLEKGFSFLSDSDEPIYSGWLLKKNKWLYK
jgi:hypothetical protein